MRNGHLGIDTNLFNWGFGLFENPHLDLLMPEAQKADRAPPVVLLRDRARLVAWICATTPTVHSTHSARVPSDRGSPCSVMCGSPASFTAARVCAWLASPMRPVSGQVLNATACETPAQRPQSLLREAAVPGLGRPGVPDPAAFVQPDAQCSFFEEAVPERFLRRISGTDYAIAAPV